jgi:hypothetical protein
MRINWQPLNRVPDEVRRPEGTRKDEGAPTLVGRRSSLVTRHSSLVTRHSSLVARRLSLVTRHSSLVTRHSSLVTRHSSLVTRHASFIILALALLLLAACGAAPGETTQPAEQTGVGGISPEAVAHSFFEDLGAALKDPVLGRDETRSYWVERLSGYFAPNERDDQREILSSTLASFADGVGQLNPDQTLTLELRFDGVEKISGNGDSAMVRPLHAAIYLVIAHTTDRGPVTDYDQTIGLDKIIGREDGAIPVIRIGDRWFLTEG